MGIYYEAPNAEIKEFVIKKNEEQLYSGETSFVDGNLSGIYAQAWEKRNDGIYLIGKLEAIRNEN